MVHDWCFFVVLPLTNREVHNTVVNGETLKFGKLSNKDNDTRSAHIACMVCEQEATSSLLSQPCPGEPDGYTEEGVPVWRNR